MSCSVCATGVEITATQSNVAWGRQLGVSENSVRRHLKHAPVVDSAQIKSPALTETTEASSDGSRSVTAIRNRPVTLDDARAWISASGDNPDDYVLSIRAIAYGVDMFSNRMSATPKRGKAADPTSKIDYAAASKFIEGFTYIPARKDFLVDASILQPTDEQFGKTDFNGGTIETEERILNSYAGYADYVKEYRPRQVLFARTGDGIENFCSTPGQRDTNDLDLPHQLVQAFKTDLAGIRMIAPLVGELITAHVPSNHGRWRVGQKGDAGDAHADFGISNAKQIAIALEMGNFGNVSVRIPEPHMESMAVRLDTARIGLVHGHQAAGADKMGEWWKGQDHGRMPTWDCDYLFVGHWHQYRAYLSGDSRNVFIGPASDPGSSWFANLKGERSSSGMLALSLIGKKWKYQDIL